MQKFNYDYCMKRSTCKWCKYEKSCEQFLNNNNKQKPEKKKRKRCYKKKKYLSNVVINKN